jgi:excisionase family DNA binding protein
MNLLRNDKEALEKYNCSSMLQVIDKLEEEIKKIKTAHQIEINQLQTEVISNSKVVTTQSVLTVSQAAEKFNRSDYFIRRLIKDKKVPCVKSGIKYYINEKKLSEYLANGEFHTEV